MNRSLRNLCGTEEHLHLQEFLDKLEYPKDGLYKCRITYDDAVKEVEFIPYEPKTIKSIRLVVDDEIEYEYKYKDRSEIDKLFEQRRSSDDILIVKNELITDASYANVVFKRGDNWYTPGSPLLHGTMRQLLLEQGLIVEESIGPEDVESFTKFKLINAMLGFEGPELDVSCILFE